MRLNKKKKEEEWEEILAQQTAGNKKQFQTPYGAIEIFISILSQCEKCWDMSSMKKQKEKCPN